MNDMAEALKKAGFDVKSSSKKKEVKRLIKFYEDGKKKILDKKWVTTEAEEWAKEFVPEPGKSSKKNLSSAQMRKFYGEVLSLEEKLKSGIPFEIVLPQIKMIKSKAAYAANPSNRKIPESFKKFLFDMVDSVNQPEDFKAFKTIFEAVIGYYYGKGVK